MKQKNPTFSFTLNELIRIFSAVHFDGAADAVIRMLSLIAVNPDRRVEIPEDLDYSIGEIIAIKQSQRLVRLARIRQTRSRRALERKMKSAGLKTDVAQPLTLELTQPIQLRAGWMKSNFWKVSDYRNHLLYQVSDQVSPEVMNTINEVCDYTDSLIRQTFPVRRNLAAATGDNHIIADHPLTRLSLCNRNPTKESTASGAGPKTVEVK